MNKYKAIRCELDGFSFPSQGERDCYQMLKFMQQAGEISKIELQVKSPLVAGISHRTDFRVFDKKLAESVYIEFKGHEDQHWKDIKKLWHVFGPGILRIYKGQGMRISMIEEILPDNLKRENQ